MTSNNRPVMSEKQIPRARAQAVGTKNLGDSELLALVLGGTQKALEAADRLLNQFGSLPNVLAAESFELAQTPGIGFAKSNTLAAVAELSHRKIYPKILGRTVLSCSDTTREYLLAKYAHCAVEKFSTIFLNTQHRILGIEELFQGSISNVMIYPREVVKRCIARNAASIILVHNHPSGIPEPSRADIHITRKIRTAVETIDIQLLDHLIVGESSVCSLAERGLL